MRRKSGPHAAYPESLIFPPAHDALTDFLDELEDRLSYRRWYFGHFHKDGTPCDERHTMLYDAVIPLGQSLHALSGGA